MGSWSRSRSKRSVVAVLVPIAVPVLFAVLVLFASTAGAVPCWQPPVVGVVTDPFRAPPCPWCAGNRGIEYQVGGEVAVRAAASGRVTYAGTVVGIGYVVIQLPNGWRHTYGQLTSTDLGAGDVVVSGRVVGRADGRVFFGLRIGDDYADPAPFLGSLVGRSRLIPVDGTPPRPAPAPSLRCTTPSGAR